MGKDEAVYRLYLGVKIRVEPATLVLSTPKKAHTFKLDGCCHQDVDATSRDVCFRHWAVTATKTVGVATLLLLPHPAIVIDAITADAPLVFLATAAP